MIRPERMHKPCVKCGAVDRNRFGACKICAAVNAKRHGRTQKAKEYRAKWRRENPDRRWLHSLTSKRKATYESVLFLFDRCGGVCEICGKVPHNGERLHLDHNHKTGKLRGFLCRRHNVAVGYFERNREFQSKIEMWVQT
jgi:hypothetical protein